MTKQNEIPKEILSDYFVLSDEIKQVSSLFPLEVFNSETFDNVSAEEEGSKKLYYFCSAAFFISLFCLALCLFMYLAVVFGSQQEIDSNLQVLRRKYAGLLLFVTAASTAGFGYFTYKNGWSGKRNLKSRLLKKAHHPEMASYIYDLAEKIIELKVPVYYLKNNRVHKFPLYNLSGAARKNAMVILLGSDKHRSALGKDGILPMGLLLIQKSNKKAIFGQLSKSITSVLRKTKDDRDNRALMTAFLYEDKMKACVATMTNAGFLKFLRLYGFRLTSERKEIIRISTVILKNWQDWEKFRMNINRFLYSPSNASDQKHPLALLAQELLGDGTTDPEKIGKILSGKDRSTTQFYQILCISGYASRVFTCHSGSHRFYLKFKS